MRIGLPGSFIILTILCFISNSAFSQIIFKEIPDYKITVKDSVFFKLSSTRNIISLNGNWKVYKQDDDEKNKVTVSVPSVFKGEAELVFEKSFNLSKELIDSNHLELFFLGLNYSADISVNDVIIYRHPGGEYPLSIELPKDILKANNSNLLSVSLTYQPNAENTIPVKQRFLFPQNFGGIFRDVYLHLTPNISIPKTIVNFSVDTLSGRVKLNTVATLRNNEFRSDFSEPQEFKLYINVISPSGNSVSYHTEPIILKKNNEHSLSHDFEISNPELWAPDNPREYRIIFGLSKDGVLLDKVIDEIPVYSLTAGKESLTLNKIPYNLKGVTHVSSYKEFGPLCTYEEMEKDISLIKKLGFNCIRFSKSIPHPYMLRLCNKYGLIAFIEIPLSGIPESIAADMNFRERSRAYLTKMLKGYKEFASFAGVGVGGSYLPDSDVQQSLIKTLVDVVNENSEAITFASFTGDDIAPIQGLDLYGMEITNEKIETIAEVPETLQNKLGKGKVFISEATYLVNAGNTDGYVNDFSFEAQAKFFEELIDYAGEINLAGYFINSAFDYRGDYASLNSGYSKENVYTLGITNEDRNPTRLAYKVVYSKLNNTERVTIPIGSKTDRAPLSYIVFGLALAIVMGVLVNSGRKFREDSSRALLRPYNFYADVRDQRIISGVHTSVLAIVIAMVSALIIANLLSYLKSEIVFEKLVIAVGSMGFSEIINYLSWHPLQALFWLSLVFILAIFLITVIIKFASFFVRHKVSYTSIYFAVIWSLLPVVLLIPLGIILLRLLNAEIINVYIYIILFLFLLWMIYRIIKSVHVIFDVNPGPVYFYGILVIIFLAGGLLLYLELKNSAVEYIFYTLNQYNIL